MKTILVVDDDAVFRRLAAVVLGMRGNRVIEAKNGHGADDLVVSGKPDLILVDGLLPDTDGISWIERQRKAGLRAPVIFVSAFWKGLKNLREVTERCGVAAFLAKPVSPGALAALVEKVLAQPSPEPPAGATAPQAQAPPR